MFAVIETGGKQLKVALNDVIRIEKLPGKKGDRVTFGEVLLVSDGKDLKVGSPTLKGTAVAGEILDQVKADKVLIFKKKRRHNYRRFKGHRQLLTVLRITEIAGSKAPALAAKKSAPAKAEAKPAAKAAAPAKPKAAPKRAKAKEKK
jgi:large subunit ribosomal protein L21